MIPRSRVGLRPRRVTYESRYVYRMSSPVNWLPLVFTTLGAGAVGSLIATYGSQARDRRVARAEAMASIQRFEIVRGRQDPVPDNMAEAFEALKLAEDDLTEVETRCLLAGIPRYLVDLYKLINESARLHGYRKATSDLHVQLDHADAIVRHMLISRAASLLASAVWHPWLTAPSRRWRAWRLQRLFFRAYPQAEWRVRNDRHFLREEISNLLEMRRAQNQPPSPQLPSSDEP